MAFRKQKHFKIEFNCACWGWGDLFINSLNKRLKRLRQYYDKIACQSVCFAFFNTYTITFHAKSFPILDSTQLTPPRPC